MACFSTAISESGRGCTKNHSGRGLCRAGDIADVAYLSSPAHAFEDRVGVARAEAKTQGADAYADSARITVDFPFLSTHSLL